MLNFPVPHQHELIYSTVARAGVYHGIESPKQLLDAVFGNRKVIATIDLPCHLQDIAKQLKNTGCYSVQDLIYQHTLFPLYAPFVTDEHKNKAIEMMAARSQGAVHLMLGVAASRIHSSDIFRYCPECVKLQREQYGEYYWRRDWYLPGLCVCPAHGKLINLPERAGTHRHQFLPLRPAVFQEETKVIDCVEQIDLAKLAIKILEIPPSRSPSFEQWTTFYHNLAADLGCCRGKHVMHDKVYALIDSRFKCSTLSQLNLDKNLDTETCWIKSIFRKHRKAFSYLEHAIVWLAFLKNIEPADVIENVRSIKVNDLVFNDVTTLSVMQDEISVAQTENRRKLWVQLVNDYGVLRARKHEDGQALYAWLYRHDKIWLLQFNAKHKALRIPQKTKLNWHHRDMEAIRNLRKFIWQSEYQLESPRLSANWLLNKLPKSDSIEKNLDKLPLVKMFLLRYTETITEYQLRRLSHVCSELISLGEPLRKWVILRKAGLSKERLTQDAKSVLNELALF